MALMERIVRPYLPADASPVKQPPKCQQPTQNAVYQFKAPAGLSSSGGGGSPPKDPQQPQVQDKKLNSSWSYAYKKYMTKKEKEQDKCGQDDKGASDVVGGQAVDTPGSTDPTGGGGGGTPIAPGGGDVVPIAPGA